MKTTYLRNGQAVTTDSLVNYGTGEQVEGWIETERMYDATRKQVIGYVIVGAMLVFADPVRGIRGYFEMEEEHREPKAIEARARAIMARYDAGTYDNAYGSNLSYQAEYAEHIAVN